MEWPKNKLINVCEIVMGQSPDSSFYNSENIGMPFLQGCAEFGKTFPNSTISTTQIKKIGKKNSILFSVRAPVGKINLADNDYCIGRGLAAINGKTVNQKFLYQYFYFLIERGGFSSQGSTFDSINFDELSKVEIIFPSSETEQTRIAEILSTADEAIEQTEKLIAKYQRIKTGLMQDLLTRGIDEHGNIRSKATHKFVVKNGIEVPEEWEVKSLDDICDLVTDGSHNSPKAVKEGFLIGNVKDMLEYDFDYDRCTRISNSDFYFLKEQNCSPQINDVLLSKDGSIGKVIVFNSNTEMVVLSSIAILRPKDMYDPYFLGYLLKSDYFNYQLIQYQSGSALKRIVVRDIKRFCFPFPTSKHEQVDIAKRLLHVDNYLISLSKELEKNKLLKTGLMHDLLSGRVRVKMSEL